MILILKKFLIFCVFIFANDVTQCNRKIMQLSYFPNVKSYVGPFKQRKHDFLSAQMLLNFKQPPNQL